MIEKEKMSDLKIFNKVENEIKLEMNDLAGAREKLNYLGAVALGTEHQQDTYFQRLNPKERITNENIRVREVVKDKNERYGYFTYKSPLDRSAQFLKRDEFETRVDNPQIILDILHRLGYEIIDRIAKTREAYKLNGMYIGLDYIEGLGRFIEIEGEDQNIISLVKYLGLNPANAINKSYSA